MKKASSTFGEVHKRNRKNKPPKAYWAGISRKLVGFIYGPPKSGKTIFVENLVFSLILGYKEFFGMSIGINNCSVFYISMEEDVDTKMMMRGKKQFRSFNRDERKKIRENLSVSDKDFIRSVESEGEWNFLKKRILEEGRDIVIIDSTNRVASDIGKRNEANEMMRRFREIAHECKCAIILIHHKNKSLKPTGISQDDMSGSSALARDADFFIGVNYIGGVRYVKWIDNRYCYYNEPCREFEITDRYRVVCLGEIDEQDLVRKCKMSEDGRVREDNNVIVLEYFKSLGKGKEVTFGLLEEELVKDKELMSRATMNNKLNILVKSGMIKKIRQGVYCLNEDKED